MKFPTCELCHLFLVWEGAGGGGGVGIMERDILVKGIDIHCFIFYISIMNVYEGFMELCILQTTALNLEFV